jgi:hypothetical protein
MRKITTSKSCGIRLLYGFLFFFLQLNALAQTPPINLLCKMDNSVDLRLTIDLDNKHMWNTWLLELNPSQEKWKIIKISDSEINAEYRPFGDSKVDGAERMFFSWNLERYTLKISEYGPLGFGRTSNWRYGKCEILKKQL